MNKILLIVTIFIIFNTNTSFSSENPCSKYNYWTQNKQLKKCEAEHGISKGNKLIKKSSSGSSLKEKSGNIISDINKKYKSLREKTPKTGVETWKKLKK